LAGSAGDGSGSLQRPGGRAHDFPQALHPQPYTLDTPHTTPSTLHPRHPTPSTPHPRLPTPSTLHPRHTTPYTQPCTLDPCNAQAAARIVLPHTLHPRLLPYTLRTIHSHHTLLTTHYTLHTTHYSLLTTHYTLHATSVQRPGGRAHGFPQTSSSSS